MPEFLVEMLKEQYGDELVKKILDGYNKKRKVTLRVNTLKSNIQEIEEILKNNKINFEKVDWLREIFIINDANEQQIEDLDIYKQGKIYLQSLSSMLPPVLLEPKENTDILDMCAAPGGKTTQIATLTNNNANITACEMNRIRLERLKYNIDKQGATSVYIMQEDSRRINDCFSFDQILLDAPCSGSGTLNVKDRNLEKYFTKNLIEKSTKSQLELLKKAIKILKPGHEMIYSTCSILKQENEEILEKILKDKRIKIVPIEMENIEDKNMVILPSKIEGKIGRAHV